MLSGGLVLLVSVGYLAALFGIASWGDKRAASGRSAIGSPWVYTLSLGVYCTAWTFYGSVGLAAGHGLAFLPIYLGPTIACLLGSFVLRKMLRITKAQGITSIADFVAARFGKSGVLAGLVTIVAALGARPLHRAAAQGRGRQHRRRHRPAGRCADDDRRHRCALCSWPSPWPASPSCSAPARSTRPSIIRGWCWRSPSRASSSSRPS